MKKLLLLTAILLVFGADSFATKKYSKNSGAFTTAANWINGVAPVNNDTIIIQSGHVMTVNSNLFSNSTYLFLIIVGTLDLTDNGKISLGGTAKVIIETGGTILGDGSNDQISIGGGPSEYTGVQGTITGPTFITNGVSPAKPPAGFGGCSGCYTPGTIPLPVLIKYFVSENQPEDRILLKWATVSEKDFEQFVIQRSVDGINYTDIGAVAGAGRNLSDVTTKYSFEDEFPLLGLTYYRLKAVDLDGEFEFFGPVAVRIHGEKIFSVYPNPASGNKIYFQQNFSASELDHVILSNQNGVELYNGSIRDLQSTVTFESRLPSGIYVVRYIGQNFENVSRLIVKN
jgi:hypothetical protein